MRLQYEVELQALRNEFYHKKQAEEGSKVKETNAETEEPIQVTEMIVTDREVDSKLHT